MATLTDISVVPGSVNLASAIANTFKVFDIEQCKEGLGLMFESLPDDNLTEYSKTQQNTSYTCQALVLNAMANGLDYSLKTTFKALDKLTAEIDEHSKGNTETEFWNVRGEQLLERLAVIEHNIDALEQVFHMVKKYYAQSTGNEWTPYVAPSKNAGVTATAVELQATLARLKTRKA